MTADPAGPEPSVPEFWQQLGLPGLVDVHVHFLPPRVMAAVWAFFEQSEEHYGRSWPIRYRDTSDGERIDLLPAQLQLLLDLQDAMTYADRPVLRDLRRKALNPKANWRAGYRRGRAALDRMPEIY